MTEWTDSLDRQTPCCTCNIFNDRHTDRQESAPLLESSGQSRRYVYEKLWLVGLGLILILGVTVGVYLLAIEDDTLPAEHFYLVTRANWRARLSSANMSQLALPAQKVLLLQSDTKNCTSLTQCTKALQNLQREHVENLDAPDILYNFIVAGDGRIYEGRGWDVQSGYKSLDAEVLTVAFLGSYEEVPPTEQQSRSLKAFLDYGIMQDILSPCIQILVQDSPRRYILDIAFAMDRHLKKENKC